MRQLKGLEARINDAPDSVLAVLTAADMPRWGERRALYALLTVQAQDKSYIDVADDSLISVATHYYTTSHDARHKMLACYYHARVQYNMGAYAQSLISASRAEEAAVTIGDDYYLGLIYRSMSESYNQTYNTTEELHYISKARECFERAGYDQHEQYARLSICKAYLGNGMFEDAMRVSTDCMNEFSEVQDSFLLAYNLRLYANACIFVGDFSNAKETLLQLLAMNQYQPDINDYCHLARVYNNKHQKDSALLSLVKAEELVKSRTDSVYIYRALYEMALVDEDAKTALKNYRKIIALNDSVTKAVLKQSVVTAHRDYYRNEVLLASLRATRDKRIFFVCLVGLLGISTLGILYYREGKKRKEIELARTIEAAHEVMLTVNRQNENLTAMQQHVDRLFGEQFTTLEILVNTYLDHEGTDRNSTFILHKVESLIEEFRDSKKLKILEGIINDSKKNIVARLREQIPSIKETDVQLFLYLCAGFSLRVINLFLKEKLENIYNKKSRLKSRIQRSNAVDKKNSLRLLYNLLIIRKLSTPPPNISI